MTISVVVPDANILFSRTLRDYLPYTADEGAIEVHWSQQILILREQLAALNEEPLRLF